MRGLGYIQSVWGLMRNKREFVTQARVLGTTYTNGNRPRLVKALIQSNQTNGAAVDNARLEISSDNFVADTTIEDELAKSINITGLAVGGSMNLQMSLWTIVPPLYQYRIRGISGSTVLVRTQEIDL